MRGKKKKKEKGHKGVSDGGKQKKSEIKTLG